MVSGSRCGGPTEVLHTQVKAALVDEDEVERSVQLGADDDRLRSSGGVRATDKLTAHPSPLALSPRSAASLSVAREPSSPKLAFNTPLSRVNVVESAASATATHNMITLADPPSR
eukprot:2397746-Prymnesium_polylepis.1